MQRKTTYIDKRMLMIEVPREMMKHVIPFIQESVEIIDAEFGKQRTYDKMVEDGVVIEGVSDFVEMFKEYKVWTQAQENVRFQVEQEALQQDNRDDRDGVISVEIEE